MKFNNSNIKNEIFVRIDMKHSCFSNYLFVIHFFVETVVVCQKIIMFMHNFCSCCIKKFKVINLTLYMYLFIEIYTYMLYLYAIYWASEASPTLGCSIEISRDICMSVCLVCQINCVGGIT